MTNYSPGREMLIVRLGSGAKSADLSDDAHKTAGATGMQNILDDSELATIPLLRLRADELLARCIVHASGRFGCVGGIPVTTRRSASYFLAVDFLTAGVARWNYFPTVYHRSLEIPCSGHHAHHSLHAIHHAPFGNCYLVHHVCRRIYSGRGGPPFPLSVLRSRPPLILLPAWPVVNRACALASILLSRKRSSQWALRSFGASNVGVTEEGTALKFVMVAGILNYASQTLALFRFNSEKFTNIVASAIKTI